MKRTHAACASESTRRGEGLRAKGFLAGEQDVLAVFFTPGTTPVCVIQQMGQSQIILDETVRPLQYLHLGFPQEEQAVLNSNVQNPRLNHDIKICSRHATHYKVTTKYQILYCIQYLLNMTYVSCIYPPSPPELWTSDV